MYFFKVEIAAEIEGDPESQTLFLQSENPDLTQKQVEEHIIRQMDDSCHAWCRVLYDSLLTSLSSAQEEHGVPMSLIGTMHTESSHPVWFGRGKRFRGNINFRRLTFDTV